MEEYVRLVVLEHLGNQLDVHILDVDFLRIIRYFLNHKGFIRLSYLKTFIQKHDGLIEFLLS
jgi:hypothetical protein